MEYNVIYSIGLRCHTEIILKKLNYVNFSSIFGSLNIKNFNNLKSVIDSDFDVLFNQNNLIFTKDINEMTEFNNTFGFRTLNKIYDDIHNYHSSTIAHHDLSLKKDIEHFERGIKRWNALKNNNIPVLFICIIHFSENVILNTNTTEKVINSFKDKGWINFHILFIYFVNNNNLNITKLLSDNNKTIYMVNYSIYTPDDITNTLVNSILSTFNINNLKTINDIDNLVH